MKTLSYILLLLGTVITSLQSESLSSRHFVITYTEKDSTYARIASDHLEEKYDEISFDFGLGHSDTFFVAIVPTRKQFRACLRGALPSWTGAFASPSVRKMVIRSPRWSKGILGYKVVLTHELLHLVLEDIVGSRRVPRWLDEGMAIFYSGEDRWKTSTAFSKALATNSYIPLLEIDHVLTFQPVRAELAYHESYSAFYYLLSTYDLDGLRAILEGLRQRRPLDEIFRQATGSPFAEFEKEWLNQARKNQRGYWLSESESYLWILILILVLLAVVVNKIRTQKIKKEWDSLPPEEMN